MCDYPLLQANSFSSYVCSTSLVIPFQKKHSVIQQTVLMPMWPEAGSTWNALIICCLSSMLQMYQTSCTNFALGFNVEATFKLFLQRKFLTFIWKASPLNPKVTIFLHITHMHQERDVSQDKALLRKSSSYGINTSML